MLRGGIVIGNIRSILFNQNAYNKTLVKDLMTHPPSVLDMEEDMLSVMNKFDENNVWYLPVTENGFFTGFVSKSNLFTHYRRALTR